MAGVAEGSRDQQIEGSRDRGIDQQIELRGAGRQIRTVLAERLKLVVSTLGVHPMGAPGLLEGVLDRLPRESALLHHTRNLFIRQQRQEQRIDPKEGVRLVLHDLAGLLEGSFQLASDEHVRRGGRHLWLQVDALGQQAPNGVVGALAPCLAERVSREPRGVVDKHRGHVHWCELGILLLERQLARVVEDAHNFLGELARIH